MSKELNHQELDRIYDWAIVAHLAQEYIDWLQEEIKEAEVDVGEWEDDDFREFAKTCGIPIPRREEK